MAAVIVTCAYIPQAWLAYKSKGCPLSWSTLIALIIAMSLWMLHATIKADWALLASSAFSLAQLIFLFTYKLKGNDKSIT